METNETAPAAPTEAVGAEGTAEAAPPPPAPEPPKVKVGGRWTLADKVMSVFRKPEVAAPPVEAKKEPVVEAPPVESKEAELEKPKETPAAPPPTAPTAADLAVLAQQRADADRRATDAERALAEARKANETKPAPQKRTEAQVIADMRREGFSLDAINKAALSLDASSIAQEETTHEVKKLRDEVKLDLTRLEQQQLNFAVQQRQGHISGMLESGDAYEQARAAGWTPERVWAEQQKSFAETGKLPSPKETLDKIESDEVARLEKLLSTNKAKAKYVPKPAEAAKPAAAAAKPAPAKTLTSGTGGAAPPVPGRKLTWNERLSAGLQKYPLGRKD